MAQQHPDPTSPIDGTNENLTDGSETSDPKVLQIITALNQGDHDGAGALIKDALEHEPENKQLLRLAARQRKQSERFTRVYALLKETGHAVEEDQFVRAVGAYREAANLCQGFPELVKAVFDAGVEQAQDLGERNWRIARTFLEDASRLNAEWKIPESLWQEVRAAEKEETIANVLDETALAKPAELERARDRLTRTLEQYPGDVSLASRLKSIEATIEEKRKWDERQKALRKLSNLRDSMQHETAPAQLIAYVARAEELAGPYGPDSEFRSAVEDIRHQVSSAERATTALKENRIDDCLEECAWVLSRMRHHQVFLNLKKQAEEREVAMADEYSSTVSRIKELLAAGKVSEADELCTKASAALPQFADLQELQVEIAARRRKDDTHGQEAAENLRRLLERGERSLRDNQFPAAEQAFQGALALKPGDTKLTGHLLGLLHGYARSAVRDSAPAAEEAMQMAGRLLPGTVAPKDLEEAIRQKRERAKEEAARWAALDRIGALNAQVDSAKKPEHVEAVRAEAQKHNFAAAGAHADVQEAAAALDTKLADKTAELAAKRARRPGIYRAVSIAATLLLGLGVMFWLSQNQRPSGSAEKAHAFEERKPVETADAKSVTPAPVPPAPAPATVATPEPMAAPVAAAPVVAEPPAGGAAQDSRGRLEFDDLDKATRIRLDGVLLTKHMHLNKEVLPGEHTIEVIRNGEVARAFKRNVGPGESVVMTPADLRAAKPAEVRTMVAVSKPAVSAPPAPAPAAPPAVTAAVAATPVARPGDEVQWQSMDRNNPEALRAFLAKYPSSSLAGEARAALGDLERKAKLAAAAAEAQPSAEEAAWKRVNQRDEASLEGYLREFPAGHYRSTAEGDLASIRANRSVAVESAAVLTVISRLENAWSARDLDSILAIQKNLSRKEVKAELAQVKQLAMKISPASPPQIQGGQAVVLCRRQASQTFADGTRKQIPESIVSYVLQKRDGNWTIEGTK